MEEFATSGIAYQKVLRDVWLGYDHRPSPRGKPIRERLFYSFKVKVPTQGPLNTGLPERDAQVAKYYSKEFDLYISGTTLAEDWATASKFWHGIANPDGKVNSNYWNTLNEQTAPGTWGKKGAQAYWNMTQWNWAFDALRVDSDTRQAFCHLNMPRDQWVQNKDMPCTMYLQFFIRDRALCMGAHMRSNDVIKGLTYDMSFFMHLQMAMLIRLRLHVPSANNEEAPLRMGAYYHHADSMHAYESDGALIEQILDCCGGCHDE